MNCSILNEKPTKELFSPIFHKKHILFLLCKWQWFCVTEDKKARPAQVGGGQGGTPQDRGRRDRRGLRGRQLWEWLWVLLPLSTAKS
jgi:hypothetical protein